MEVLGEPAALEGDFDKIKKGAERIQPMHPQLHNRSHVRSNRDGLEELHFVRLLTFLLR